MKAIYDSAFHHPLVAYVVGVIGLFVLARRVGFVYGYVAVFLVEILADATVTGAWSPVPMGTATYKALTVVFVILGDFRYFLLLERVARPNDSFVRVLVRASAISFIVPITSLVLMQTVPAVREDRVLYLVYEVAAAALVLLLDRQRFRDSDASIDERRFMHDVTRLFAGLYLGWAACDVVILAGAPIGHVLRIVPNVLYYGVFVVFVLLTAPPAMLRRWPMATIPAAPTAAERQLPDSGGGGVRSAS